MQLFSLDLVQFYQEVSQYGGYLSTAIAAGPCGTGGKVYQAWKKANS